MPITLLPLLCPLPRGAAIVAACRRYHCGEKNVRQQYYICFLYFALAITIVSLMANAIVSMMATAPAMIYYCLFYDSYDNSGDYIFLLIPMKEINGGRGGGCCCFCNGDDNGYADDDCNGNDDNND